MKKYFVLLALIFSGALSIKAQDVIMTRDYSLINAVVSEIGEDYVTYKAFDNQNGPDIKIGTKKIFKITFSNGSEQFFDASGSMVETKAEAQPGAGVTENGSGASAVHAALLKRIGNDLVFQDNGASWVLTPETVSQDFWKNYQMASIMKDSGEWLWCIGLGGLLGSLLGYALADAPESGETFLIVSTCITVPLIAVGIPLDVVGTNRLDKLADAYNKKKAGPYSSLSFGVQRHGIGFALNF